MVDILASSPVLESFRLGDASRSAASRSDRDRTMPLDFAAYLLSASPPSFEFYNLKKEKSSFGKAAFKPILKTLQKRDITDTQANSTSSVANSDITQNGDTLAEEAEGLFFMDNCQNINTNEATVCIMTEIEDYGGDSNLFGTLPQRLSELSLSGLKKKKVTFADDNGLSLTSVRMFQERSEDPPYIRSELISALTCISPPIAEQPPLTLRFKQPAADYLTFRANVDSNNVSLENVVLKGLAIKGTVKVKNICFEKHVFVRGTFDNWKSYRDVTADYVPSSPHAHAQMDTFSFEMTSPCAKSTKIEFCVCFRAQNGQEFWDNNYGRNYEIVTSDWQQTNMAPHDVTVFHKSLYSYGEPHWGGFGSWVGKLDDVPYW